MPALSFVPSHFIFTLLLLRLTQPLLLLLLHSSSSLVTQGTALKWQTTFGSSPCRTAWKRKMPWQQQQQQREGQSGRRSWRDDARTCHCTIIGFRNISRIFNKKTENRWNASNTHNTNARPSALRSHSLCLSLPTPKPSLERLSHCACMCVCVWAACRVAAPTISANAFCRQNG